MRKTTKGKDFGAAVVITILVAALMLLLTAALVIGYFGGSTDGLATAIIFFCALMYLAVAVGVVAALWQRWKEIQGGEEDEAKKY